MYLQIGIIIAIVIFIIVYLKQRDDFISDPWYVVPEKEQGFIDYVIDKILDDINKSYNKNYVKGKLDHVTKNCNDDYTQYIVNYFISDKTTFAIRKYVFDFNINEDKTIKINSITAGDSENPIFIYNENSAREALIYKPPEIDVPKVLEYDNLNKQIKIEKKTEVPLLERNQTILPNDNLKGKVSNFPCRIIEFNWNKDGVMKESEKKNDCFGGYSGASKPPFSPNYNPTLFSQKTEESEWLFNFAKISASEELSTS